MLKSKVVVLKTTPETVVEDYIGAGETENESTISDLGFQNADLADKKLFIQEY